MAKLREAGACSARGAADKGARPVAEVGPQALVDGVRVAPQAHVPAKVPGGARQRPSDRH